MAAAERHSETDSASAYFGLLLERAIEAGRQGNYAISAALSARQSGSEVITLGANSLFGDRDPTGHAEMNAIRLAHRLGHAHEESLVDVPSSDVVIRDAADERSEMVLYTTLEPCPMCTVAIINSGINRVVIAAEDPEAGSLSPQRLGSLPPLWPELADSIGLEVCFAQSQDPTQAMTYLEPQLRSELIEVFLHSRESLDQALADGGVLDLRAIQAYAERARQPASGRTR